MTAALLDPPASRVHRTPSDVTLEGAIARIWEDLTARHTAACPVCAGPMVPRLGASGPAPVGGRCTDCGSTLA